MKKYTLDGIHNQARKIYAEKGQSAVYTFADSLPQKVKTKFDIQYRQCWQCETNTPHIKNGVDECLVCGTIFKATEFTEDLLPAEMAENILAKEQRGTILYNVCKSFLSAKEAIDNEYPTSDRKNKLQQDVDTAHDLELTELEYDFLKQVVNILSTSTNGKKMPNGFASWMETHHEIVSFLTDTSEIEEGLAYKAREEGGTGRVYELAEQLTDEFEQKNEGKFWDGEFFDEIDNFLTSKVNAPVSGQRKARHRFQPKGVYLLQNENPDNGDIAILTGNSQQEVFAKVKAALEQHLDVENVDVEPPHDGRNFIHTGKYSYIEFEGEEPTTEEYWLVPISIM